MDMKSPGAAPLGGGAGPMRVVGVFLVGLVLLAVTFFGCAFLMRNRIIRQDETARASWANVESAYQRRLDLVPNLVRTVEASAKFEGETLKEITSRRNQLLAVAQEMRKTVADPEQAPRTQELDTQLIGAIRAFTGLAAEAYPQLRSTEAFQTLMSQLEGTENRINVARGDYNAAVAQYNTTIRTWGWLPMTGDPKPREPFRAAPEAGKAPDVKFD